MKKTVMMTAWRIARKAALKFGGKVKEFFRESLRIAWRETKGENKVKEEKIENYCIEIKRTNVTLEQFLSYIKYRCKKKEITNGFDLNAKEIAKDYKGHASGYYIENGKKYSYHSTDPSNCYRNKSVENTSEPDGTSAFSKDFPCDLQTFIRRNDGSLYNEILEFVYEDDNKGYGYYYLEALNW